MVSVNAHADARSFGNGGDEIRWAFLNTGKSLLAWIDGDPVKSRQLKAFRVRAGKLAATLTTRVVEVAAGPLIDNHGSVVDALGTPGRIVLDQAIWQEDFERVIGSSVLVMHEMLRAAAYDDDDYAISESFQNDALVAARGVLRGQIDGIVVENKVSYLVGWSCAYGVSDPVRVNVLVGGPINEGKSLGSFAADFLREPEVAIACGDPLGNAHGFHIPLGGAAPGQPAYVYADAHLSDGSYTSRELLNSGKYTVR